MDPEQSPKYKKGDLVMLNDFGLLIVDGQIYIGVVVSDPYYKWWPPGSDEAVGLQYWAYDVMFGSDLVDLVPEDMLDIMVDKVTDEK